MISISNLPITLPCIADATVVSRSGRVGAIKYAARKRYAETIGRQGSNIDSVEYDYEDSVMRKAKQYGREKRRHACQRVECDEQADYGKYVLGNGLLLRQSENGDCVCTVRRFGVRRNGEGLPEKNVDTTQEFARQLSQAKDLRQVLQIQMEFMQAHLQAFEEEARIFREAFTKLGRA